MKWKCEEVQDRTLRPAADEKAFRLHLAALDWSLVDPIVINGPADIKAVNWQGRVQPFTHQVQNLVTFCRRLPVALIADDVGLGKTISAGLILSELITRRRVNRALILCPKVLAPQWVAELDEKFGLVAKDVTGAGLDAEFQRSTQVVVTTYDSARSRLEKIEPGTFDLCILDEAHKLRNLYGTQKPPALAVNVRKALERRPFRFVLMLTATPIQNKVWDLYSLIDLLKVAEGKPNPLGLPDEFNARFVEPGSSGRKLQPMQADTFRRLVRESLSRTRRSDVKLRFPDRRVDLVRVTLQIAEQDMIRIVAGVIDRLNGLQQVSIAQAMMSSPRALVAQAENMARTGTLEDEDVADLRRAADRVAVPAKLAALFQLLDHLRDRNPGTWRAVVFTVRRDTQEMIGDALRARGVPLGFIRGGDGAANQKAIAAYRQDPPKNHVIVSTDAGAEGVNLQAGNVLINYDLPWNPMIVEQRIGRVQRLGSAFDRVVILNLVGAGTVEDRIVARLTEKLQGVSQAIGDIEGILEAADIDADDGEQSFEARVRKMVVQALKGQDVSKAQQMIERNIDDAKQLFESQRVELDATLGDGGEPKGDQRPLPKIERKPPKMSYRDFVLDAKRADGFAVRQIDEDTFEAAGPGRVPEKISFADVAPPAGKGVFSAQSAKSFMPGKRDFERLVQHWVDHHAHRVADLTAGSRDRGLAVAREWVAGQPGCEFVAAEYQTDRDVFQGVAVMRVRAGNGVDSFEKVLRGRIPTPAGHGTVAPDAGTPRVPADVRVSDVLPQFQSIQSAVERDAEVGEFCAFYVDRLREALAAAGTDPGRRSKVDGDFRPYVQAEVMGLEGAKYETGIATVAYRADGVIYRSRLTVIAATRQVVTAPAPAACAVTGAVWPADCLGECAATKTKVLLHRLQQTTAGVSARPDHIVTCEASRDTILLAESGRSAVSGVLVHRRHLRECELTGDLALPAELGASDLSGRTARKDRLVKSALSGRFGLPSEMVECQATGRKVLADEAVRSAATKDWYAKDQLFTSAVSGKQAPPPDMATCEATGDWVFPAELETCTVSWKKVRRDRLVQSVESRRWLLPAHAARTDDGHWALPAEIGECAWRGRKLLVSELGACVLTGLIVDKRWLSPTGELLPVRQALDGRILGEPLSVQEHMWLTMQPGWEKTAVDQVRKTVSPSWAAAVLIAEVRGLFGWRVRHHGVVVRLGPEPAFLSQVLVGVRREGKWSPA